MNAFMQVALDTAKEGAVLFSEIPVGAAIVHQGKVIARAHNRREELHDPTAHAEILAIREAAAFLQDWRLTDCDLYVTLEPCEMCMAAIRAARIRRVYCGAYKPKDAPHAKEPEVYYGMEEDACAALLQDFFRQQRAEKETSCP